MRRMLYVCVTFIRFYATFSNDCLMFGQLLLGLGQLLAMIVQCLSNFCLVWVNFWLFLRNFPTCWVNFYANLRNYPYYSNRTNKILLFISNFSLNISLQQVCWRCTIYVCGTFASTRAIFIDTCATLTPTCAISA